MSGTSVAGGSASTWASSSGVAGIAGGAGVAGLLLADPQAGADAALGVEVGFQLLLERPVVLDGRVGQDRLVARGGAAQLVRVGEQTPVERGAALQLLVRTDVGELALLQNGDPVGEAEGGTAVGDQQGRAARHHLRQGLVDLVLDAGVDGGGGVVEEKQPGVGEDGAGERDALALAA